MLACIDLSSRLQALLEKKAQEKLERQAALERKAQERIERQVCVCVCTCVVFVFLGNSRVVLGCFFWFSPTVVL